MGDMHELVRLAKGLIGPGELNPGGALRPEASERLIGLVFEAGFMKNVTTRRMKRLTADVGVFDLPRRSLVRVAEGSEPSAGQKVDPAEHGTTLTALPCQLYADIPLSFLRDNQDNPTVVSDLEASFARLFEGEFEDLAFNGTADTGASFLELNRGWLDIADDTVACPKVDIDPTAAGGWRAALKAALAAVPDQWRPQVSIVMNEGDADAYGFELGGHVTGTALVADSPLRRFLGRPIITSQFMPAGKALVTPPKNLVFGLTTDVRAEKQWSQRKRALEYTYDWACDYEIAIKSACVLAYNLP